MKHRSSLLSALVALSISACAATPSPTPAPVLDTTIAGAATPLPNALGCVQLEGQIARAEETLRNAEEKSQNAWKAVVPFAVVARYASNKAAANEAQESLDGLRTQSVQLGCTGHGG